MKKLFLIFILFCSQSESKTLDGSYGNIDAKKALSSLTLNETKLLKSYDGIFFDTVIVNNEPYLDVSRIRGVREGLSFEDIKEKVKLFLSIIPNVSNSDMDKTKNRIKEAMNSTNPVVLGNVIETKDDGRVVLKFDFLDKNGKVRMMKWLDKETGFSIKTVVLDSNGSLISLIFYKNLVINKINNFSDFKIPTNGTKSFTVLKAIQRYKVSELDNVINLEKLADKIVNETIDK